MINLRFNSLFVFSEEKDVCFFKKFEKRINIITGCNTSGKSTLVQSFLYTFGINDVNEKLNEILDIKPIFRLDFSISKNNVFNEYTIIRDDNVIYFYDNKTLKTYYGISANNSKERIKYKKFISQLFEFNLSLEQNSEFKPAPLEAFFLPYYISQAVGWVYIRESFSNLNFYKNFKEDYLDYYFDISSSNNRDEFIELKKRKSEISTEIKTVNKHITEPELELAKLVDENFGKKAQEYVNEYVNLFKTLQNKRREKINLANEIAIYENLLKIARKTKKELKQQKYDGIDTCPACLQVLEHSLERVYEYYQKTNDNERIEDFLKNKLKEEQSRLNSINKKIEYLTNTIEQRYNLLQSIEEKDINYETWVDIKASSRLYKRLENQKTSLDTELTDINSTLKTYDENEVKKFRYEASKRFKVVFQKSLKELSVKELKEERYLDIYGISSFPYQGVELHSTILAYNFCFNKVIQSNKNIHRLPFLVDGILKEDIDPSSLRTIFNFVSQNLPRDTQSFITISDYEPSTSNSTDGSIIDRFTAEQIQQKFFPDDSDLIVISKSTKRSFLSNELDKKSDIYNETIELMTL